MRKIEVCCTSLQEVKEAFAGGALRVEFCTELQTGGITPPMQQVEDIVEKFPDRPVNVLLRPRGGNFVYIDEEAAQVVEDMERCKRMGVHGVVIGALTEVGGIDLPLMRRWMAVAKPQLSVTFHRAFDECAEPFQALEQIIGLGCDRLLTSGRENTAPEGIRLLRMLVEQAAGRIVVMPGSGVRTWNIGAIERACGAAEYHSTAHGDNGQTDRRIVEKLVNYWNDGV